MSEATPPDGKSVELPPDVPSTAPLWLLLLAGPILWMVHFMGVYLIAEAACAAVESDAISFFGSDVLVVTVVAATIVAAVAAGGATVLAWRRTRSPSEDRRELALAGMLLGGGSVLAILAVGLPALAFPPC